MKNKLIAGITTKNEDRIANKVLQTLITYCDKIVVYDDGSTDQTETICRSYDQVEWYVRPLHDPFVREEAKQRQELIGLMCEHDPDYVLLLDADEIPTPSIVPFLDTLDKEPRKGINLWRARMINLWEDESQYRVDSYQTRFGTQVRWDPFGPHAWFKFPLLRYDKNLKYAYRVEVQKGGCSRYHPSPENVPGVPENQEDFYVIHYGKMADDFLNEDRLKFYAKIEERDGKGSYEQRLMWHKEHNRTDTLQTKATDPAWFWDKE